MEKKIQMSALLDLLLVPSKGFCESLLWGHPEYINSITAIPIILSGIYGLYNLSNSINISPIWRLIYCLFIINGISSFGYHYTAYFFWKFIDEYTMIIAVYIGIYQASELLLYKYIIMDNKLSKEYYTILMNTSSSILMILCTISTAFLAVDIHTNDVIGLSFTCAMFYLFGLCGVGRFIIYKKESINSKEFKKLFEFLGKTFKISIFAVSIWFMTEPFCNDIIFIRYLHTHGIWHIAASIATYGFCLLGVFIDYYNHGFNPILIDTKIPFHPIIIVNNIKQS